MIEYFKERKPDIEENHCICKACELACRKKTNQTILPQSELNNSENSFHYCHLSNFNLCPASQNTNDMRFLIVSEAEMTQVFSLPVDATSFDTIEVYLCSHHRLQYFHDKIFNCTVCHKRFERGVYKKKFPENMLNFANINVSSIPGNNNDERNLDISDMYALAAFMLLKSLCQIISLMSAHLTQQMLKLNLFYKSFPHQKCVQNLLVLQNV